QRFDPCLALYLIVAWRILFMTMVGRASPSLSSECLFEPIEWQTAYVMIYEKPPPNEPPTLKDTLRMIAQLGGFLGRKHDGEPGPIVMWKGLRTLYEYIKAREVFTRAFGHTYG
ncbi:Transposase Tn5 dimerisation domain-containing protein, partial [Legionella israelensis DSM 19235]